MQVVSFLYDIHEPRLSSKLHRQALENFKVLVPVQDVPHIGEEHTGNTLTLKIILFKGIAQRLE